MASIHCGYYFTVAIIHMANITVAIIYMAIITVAIIRAANIACLGLQQLPLSLTTHYSQYDVL